MCRGWRPVVSAAVVTKMCMSFNSSPWHDSSARQWVLHHSSITTTNITSALHLKHSGITTTNITYASHTVLSLVFRYDFWDIISHPATMLGNYDMSPRISIGLVGIMSVSCVSVVRVYRDLAIIRRWAAAVFVIWVFALLLYFRVHIVSHIQYHIIYRHSSCADVECQWSWSSIISP